MNRRSMISLAAAALVGLCATGIAAAQEKQRVVETSGYSTAMAVEPVAQASAKSKPNSVLRKTAQVPACVGVPNNQLGNCIVPPDNLPNFNCSACCALRGALNWIPAAGPIINCMAPTAR
jgi:hypothetical protein